MTAIVLSICRAEMFVSKAVDVLPTQSMLWWQFWVRGPAAAAAVAGCRNNVKVYFREKHLHGMGLLHYDQSYLFGLFCIFILVPLCNILEHTK